MKQKIYWVIGIVAVLVILLFIYKTKSSSTPETTKQDTTPITNSDTTNNNSDTDIPKDPDNDPQTPTSETIAVSTQLPGSSITVDNAYLSQPGFIEIREATSNGAPGKSVGSSGYLTTGPKQDLIVNAKVDTSHKYYAIIVVDNGDKKFGSTDTPALKNGLPVQTLFSVSQ